MAARVSVAAAFVAFVFVAILVGLAVFRTESIWPVNYTIQPILPEPSPFLDGIDKLVSMAFSLTLGLFVLVGFVLREMSPAERVSGWTIVLCGVFLFGSILAIYMGFLARNVGLYYVSFRSEASITLAGRFISLQMLAVAASGLASIMLLGEHYLRRIRPRRLGKKPR